jgi:hypothetical protein
MSTKKWKSVPTRMADVGDGAPARRWSRARRVLGARGHPGFDSYQGFTQCRIPVAVLERRAG